MLRWPRNPILSRLDIPPVPPHLVDVSSVFNPGAVMHDGRVVLLLRVQNRGRETFFMVAESADGFNFAVRPEAVRLHGLERVREAVYHCYDGRITKLDGRYYVLFAMDMDTGCRLGLAVTDDFRKFEFRGIVSEGDSRNGVLFSERVGGKYLRLERPNDLVLDSGVRTGNTIVLAESDDLQSWRARAPLLSGRFHYWDELIGAGPPPIKTRSGWLCLYHGVATHFSSTNIYQAGIFLLDLQEPWKLLARGRYNVLEPREPYELTGQVPNVVFPSGAVVREVDKEGFATPESEVLVYYGAADTAVALAIATVRELLDAAWAGHDRDHS